jgi:hypothetical protein
MGVACNDAAAASSADDCNGLNPPSGKIGYALHHEFTDEAVVVSVCQVVQVLHTDYLCDCLSLRQLLGTDVAQTEMPDQSLTLEFGKHGQRFFDGSLRWRHHFSNPKIDDIQRVESQISEIVMNAVDQFLTRKRRDPGLVFRPGARLTW